MNTIEHERPEFSHKLWNPDHYLEEILTPDKLPIDRDYTLSLVEAFLTHHVLKLDADIVG